MAQSTKRFVRKVKKPPDKDVINKYKKHITSYKCVKTSLKSIIKNGTTLPIINKMVCNMNQIVVHTYHFLKLYCINQFNTTGTLPIIDKKFVVLIMKTIAEADIRGRKFGENSNMIKNKLEIFYDDVYEPLMMERRKLSYTNLSNMLEYEATSIVTCISNHIQENFDKMLNRYINIMFNKKKLDDMNPDASKLFYIRSTLKKIKNDILHNENKSDEKYTKFINNFKNTILKDVNVNKSLMYMAKSKPLDLLIVLIRMSVEGEKISLKHQPSDEVGQLFNVINCFPTRKSIIPKYVDIDISIIITNFVNDDIGYYNENKLACSDELWDMFFKTGMSVFKKNGYTFNRRISTDGVGCSISFVREDLFNPFEKTYVPKMKKPKGYSDDLYVNKLTQSEKDYCLSKQLVGIDPGKNDLIHCSNGIIKKIHKSNGKIFRKACHYNYSQKLRKETIKSDIYAKKIDKDKKDHGVIFRTNGSRKKEILTIKEVENKLSSMNSSSCMWINVLKYIKNKNEVNDALMGYYKKHMYRQLKWYSFINKQKSDVEIVNRFKSKFGSSKKTAILIGDYEQIKQMKYKEPSKGKSIRKLFRDHGYKVYLVDEFRTSCMLYEEGEKLINVRNCHTLLGSKILNGKMSVNKPDNYMKTLIAGGYIPTIINRDLNASLNIRLKGWHILHGLKEPDYMCRSKCMKDVFKKRLKDKIKISKHALIKTN